MSEETEVLDLDAAEFDPGADLDLEELEAACDRRILAMKEAGRTPENISKTYAAAVKGVIGDNRAAISDAIRLIAQSRRATLDKMTKSEAYKRKALCSEVIAGTYDK
jgi:hypothetical protein